MNQQLSGIEVAAIDDQLVPFLAAAAAEMALESGITWRFSTDDPAVLSLRLIAKVALTNPNVGGPHTDRLLAHLKHPVLDTGSFIDAASQHRRGDVLGLASHHGR